MRRAEKALAGRLVEHGEQRIEIAGHIEQSTGFVVQPELRPGENFAQFVQSAKAAGCGNEQIGQIGHQRLACMHAVDDVQLRQVGVRHLAFEQMLRDDADHLAAGVECGVGDQTHQADVAAAIDQAVTTHGEQRAEDVRRFCVDRGITAA